MKIKKIFPDAVAIATASSRAFLPYTGVMIRSITACMDIRHYRYYISKRPDRGTSNTKRK